MKWLSSSGYFTFLSEARRVQERQEENGGGSNKFMLLEGERKIHP